MLLGIDDDYINKVNVSKIIKLSKFYLGWNDRRSLRIDEQDWISDWWKTR